MEPLTASMQEITDAKKYTTHWNERILVFKTSEGSHRIPYPEIEKWGNELTDANMWTRTRKHGTERSMRCLLLLYGKEGEILVTDFLAKLSSLMDEFQRRDKFSDSTKQVYESYVKRVLQDYQKFLINKNGFRISIGQRNVYRTSPAIPMKQPIASPENIETKPPITAQKANLFPLGNNRFVEFVVPDDLTQREAVRFYFHLLSYAPDFNPTELINASIWKDPAARLSQLENALGMNVTPTNTTPAKAS